MCIAYREHIDITVQTAVESEVCHLRIYVVVWCIVHSDNDFILIFQQVSDVDSPCGISTVMAASLFSVHIKCSAGISTLELHINVRLLAKLGTAHCFCIIACATVIVIATILSVCAIPCMWQINLLPAAICQYRRSRCNGNSILGKLP